MNETYKCYMCGEVFNHPNVKREREEFYEGGWYYSKHCPYCGSEDFYEFNEENIEDECQ